jgi:hypothetical protein
MKNKMSDLKNHLFAALERLNDDTLTDDQIKSEISRAQAIAEIGKVIVEGAKTSVLYAKITGKAKELPDDDFIDAPVVSMERPKAEYSNSGHQKALDKYAS